MTRLADTQTATRTDPRPFFSPKTLAAHLLISERTCRQLLTDRVIPSYRVGGLRRIDQADVDAYLVTVRDDRAATGATRRRAA
jgi:excisionase family DNA binding protein